MDSFMKKQFISVILLAFISTANAAQPLCNKSDAPKVIKPMENWDIIATNTGNIPTATVFSGSKLTYTVSAHPKNSKNIITINKVTGVINVTAEKKDAFDITVNASNPCGMASNTFNVIIDEEE